uniref:Peptidase M20 dimerisation domain-containing protein n=1 Tax=Plectus sambesii TaxID=2011161 RepID=A0A914VP35_9BILA
MTAANPALDKLFKYVDEHADQFVERLREAVEIPSVSAEPEHRPDVLRMIEWTRAHLEKLGATCELKDCGEQVIADGSKLKLPPILLAVLGNDPNKKTLLVYGHLDVQPAAKADGWHTDPFKLIEKDGKMFGRGSTDDKGPVIAWINAIEAIQATGGTMPLNVKFCLEGMEESGSLGLDDVLVSLKDTWLKDVDFTCISDNYWLGKNKPCITYGLRGMSYFFVEISAVNQDLHSGVFGGTVYEPMNDMVWLLSKLSTVDGTILVPGIKEMVAPVTDAERKLYDAIEFDIEDYRNDIGASRLSKTTKEDLLMHRWRFPSLSIHGIEGGFSGTGAKTVIPAKVTGKFSIRSVPDMTPEKINDLVSDYLNETWVTRQSPNTMKVIPYHSGKPWVADFNHPNFQAGARAIKIVHGMEPDYTREGGSIPVTLTFQELTGKNVMLLPIGACDDMAHSQNEKLNRSNYIQGTKILGAYFYEIAAVP